MSPRGARGLALAGAALVACTGRLDYEPSAYFGGAVSLSDGGAGAGGPSAPADAAARPPATDPVRPPPGAPDAEPLWAAPDADIPWDAPAPAADAAPAPMAAPDAAVSGCAGPEALALLSMRCGGCHNATSAAKGLDLRSPGLGARVVGVPSTCQGRPYLVAGPGAPVGHLLDKMEGPVPGCGNQMPFGGPSLTDEEKDCVREWAAQAIAKVQNGKVMP